MESVPAHFHPETLKFLRGLVRNNDREWFEARREVFEEHVKAPMLALIEELNASMTDFAPDHVRTPAKTMMRIYRDTRFSKNKLPYKKHVSAWFGRRGAIRTTGPGFYLHVSAEEVHFGAGVFMPLPEQLLSIRRWMAENHTHYNTLLKRATRASKDGLALTVADMSPLSRMPKGFPADHPAGEVLRARRWGVLYSAPADTALQPGFSKQMVKLFKSTAPVVLAFDEAVDGGPGATPAKRMKSMF